MPFKSEKQRRYLYANKPEVARQLAKDYSDGGPVSETYDPRTTDKYGPGTSAGTNWTEQFGVGTEGNTEMQKQMKELGYTAASFTPIIGDAIGAKELWDELQKNPISWGMVALLGGGLIIGLVPGLGDAAAKAMKAAVAPLMRQATRLGKVDTSIRQQVQALAKAEETGLPIPVTCNYADGRRVSKCVVSPDGYIYDTKRQFSDEELTELGEFSDGYHGDIDDESVHLDMNTVGLYKRKMKAMLERGELDKETIQRWREAYYNQGGVHDTGEREIFQMIAELSPAKKKEFRKLADNPSPEGDIDEILDWMGKKGKVQLYRGAKGYDTGVSWTNNPSIAFSFSGTEVDWSGNLKKVGDVYEADVNTDDVLMIIWERGEFEFILDPAKTFPAKPTTLEDIRRVLKDKTERAKYTPEQLRQLEELELEMSKDQSSGIVSRDDDATSLDYVREVDKTGDVEAGGLGMGVTGDTGATNNTGPIDPDAFTRNADGSYEVSNPNATMDDFRLDKQYTYKGTQLTEQAEKMVPIINHFLKPLRALAQAGDIDPSMVEDAYQNGMLAVLEAQKNFKAGTNSSFITYAWERVKNAVMNTSGIQNAAKRHAAIEAQFNTKSLDGVWFEGDDGVLDGHDVISSLDVSEGSKLQPSQLEDVNNFFNQFGDLGYFARVLAEQQAIKNGVETIRLPNGKTERIKRLSNVEIMEEFDMTRREFEAAKKEVKKRYDEMIPLGNGYYGYRKPARGIDDDALMSKGAVPEDTGRTGPDWSSMTTDEIMAHMQNNKNYANGGIVR